MSKWIKYEIDANTLEFRYEVDSKNQNSNDETYSNIQKTKLEEVIKVPKLIGNRFEVYDILSKGGFGVILKAKNKVLKDREVLIKTSIYNDIKQELIHKYDVSREETINQRRNDLRNEYQRLIMFRNGGESRMPSVIDVIEDYSPQLYGPHTDAITGEEFYLEEFKNNEVYLVMQNIDGINLGNYISKGIDNILQERNYKTILFWEVAVLEYIKEIVNIFATFHRKKYKGNDYFYFIYQDLKPDNIMLTYDKFITLIDFGGILMVGNIDGETYSNFEDAGIPGCGTFGYMPREMCESEELKRLDNRADIYTIGATMYSLLSGKNPLDDAEGATQKIPVDKLVEMGYTQETIQVIKKATSIDRDERHKSIESLHKEIIRCLGNVNRQINKIQSFKRRLSMQYNNSVLGGRYEILNPQEFDNENKEKIIGLDRFYYFNDIVERDYARVQLNLGKDKRLSRVVILKSPKYRECDYESEDTILERRKAIEIQIDLLNDLKSPLLPEPIDYLKVVSDDNKIPYSLRKNEPVLVLDYQSGKTLEHMINRLVKDNRKIGLAKEVARMGEINRICKNIITFLKVLKEKEYAYQGLNLKHILLLKDNSLRFLGLGSICKTKNGKLDPTHKNFGVTTLGYSAPELNNMSLLNWGADYATSESVGAFSLGVILHQLIIGRDLSYEEDIDIIGKNGSLRYPNGKTESIIKSCPFGTYKIHKLISDLCKEDPFDRLTDYDEILARLENIFENRRNQIKSSTNLKSISRFNLFNAEDDATNKHCILDNELLEECEVLVDYYLKGKSIPMGKLPSKAYICKSCNELSNYYIDTESYSHLQMSLEDKQNEIGEELEFKVIESEDIKGIDTIIINNESDNLCLAHERKLKIQKVAINYYLRGVVDKPQGKLYLDLPVCKKCSKAHINDKQLNEINKILSSKLNNNNCIFNLSKNKDILPKINKIYMLDKEFEHCISDLHKLKNKYVVVQYIKDDKIEKLMIGLKYCKECDKYYINQHGIIYLNKNIPANCKKLFTIEKLGITVDSVIRIFDKEKLCTVDGCKLDKKAIALNWYEDSSRTKVIGKIKVGAWICPHGEVYIKEETERRLNRLIQKHSGYISINQPIRPIANTVRIINQNTDICKKNHELRKAIIDIEYIDKNDNDRYLIENSEEVAYCDICKEAYLTDEEYDNISNLLDDNCYIDKKKNLIDIPVLNNIIGNLFRRKK